MRSCDVIGRVSLCCSLINDSWVIFYTWHFLAQMIGSEPELNDYEKIWFCFQGVLRHMSSCHWDGFDQVQYYRPIWPYIIVSGPKERLFISFALSVSDKVLFLVKGAWVTHCYLFMISWFDWEHIFRAYVCHMWIIILTVLFLSVYLCNSHPLKSLVTTCCS